MALDPLQRLQARKDRAFFQPEEADKSITQAENLLALKKESFDNQQETNPLQYSDLGNTQTFTPSAMVNREDLPPITQTFGQKSQYDVFSGGVNYGVDYGVKEGTPVGLPAGQWEVVEAFNQASGQGFIGNKENRGYGNSVLVRNTKTGESLRLSHLSKVSNIRPGQVIPGGTVVGASGATGNVGSAYGGTGAHLDVEYRDSSGNLNDVLRTPYATQIVGRGGFSDGRGGGIVDLLRGAKEKYLDIAEPQPNQPVRNFLRSNLMTNREEVARTGNIQNKIVANGQPSLDNLTPKEKRDFLNQNINLVMGLTSPIKSRAMADRVAMSSAARVLNSGTKNVKEFSIADRTITNLLEKYVPKSAIQRVSKKIPIGRDRTNALIDLIDTYMEKNKW